jgi:membrane-associated phospholipid phosphatase
MRESMGLPGERTVVDTLHRFSERTPHLHETAVGFASVGIVSTGLFVAAGALVLGVRQRRVTEALATVAAAAVAYGITHVLKASVTRVSPLTYDPSHHSFPEGPGAFTAALAVGLVPRAPRLAALTVAMTVLDGVSQVALGYHWPTDVLAAWAIGIGCGLGARALASGMRRTRPQRGRAGRLRE